MRFFTSLAIVETARPNIVAIWAKVSRHSSPWAMPFLVSRVMCFAMTSSFSFAFVVRARPERPARRMDFPHIVACGDGRRAGGRPGDVMSDLCAVRTATSFGQRRESRAAKARSAESTRSTGRATRQKPIVKVNERPSLGRVGGRGIRYPLQSTPQPSPLTNKTKSKIEFTLAKHHFFIFPLAGEKRIWYHTWCLGKMYTQISKTKKGVTT